MNDQDSPDDDVEKQPTVSQADEAAAPATGESQPPRPRLKIGSQRQATGVIRAKPQISGRAAPQPEAPARQSTLHAPREAFPHAEREEYYQDSGPSHTAAPAEPAAPVNASVPSPLAAPPPAPSPSSPPPSLRETLADADDMEAELAEAMGDLALDAMLAAPTAATSAVELEPDSQHRGRVLFVRGSNVFVDLGGRNQGIVPATQFEVLPKPEDVLQVSIRKFDQAEGLYELSAPGAAMSVAGWDQLSEGMVVEAAVTGHNAGGLEVEVNKLRGFIPISQVSLYRVEALAEFVGQRFACVVTEVNPEARNLVLSRRAMLERERAEAKTRLIQELEVGQTREGVVTRIQPFGAFVDLGGVDGLIHVSQMSWERVADPNQVLTLGQRIKVRVTKIDPDTGKIGLSYREKWENPWETAASKYPAKTKVSGTVSKLMDFGAFVKLEPGIEGLIHISELSHRRVFRAGDVVKEGQEVDVLVLSVDAEQQRISLSLKALEARPEPAGKKKEEEGEAIPTPIPQRKNQGPLKGGVGHSSGGEKFGLKW